jgi:hypothetical protein
MASRNDFDHLIALAAKPETAFESPDASVVNDPINPAGSSRKAVISFISGGDSADVAAFADTELLLNPDVFDDLLAQTEEGLDDDREMEQEIQRLAHAAQELADLINHRRSAKGRGG